jgi:hypothetical protein
MSEEKEEALRQINEIKSHLVDKQAFFPYNYYATYVWAFIALVMTFSMIPLYEHSILLGTVFAFLLISIGFATEGFLTKRVNKDYDIEDCTARQQFIMQTFMMLSFFVIAVSAILASYRLYVPMFLTWLFLVSLGYFSVGFVLNIHRFTQMARFNMMAAILLMAMAFLSNGVEGSESTFVSIVQILLVLGLTFMPSFIAWYQLKEGK